MERTGFGNGLPVMGDSVLVMGLAYRLWGHTGYGGVLVMRCEPEKCGGFSGSHLHLGCFCSFCAFLMS